MSRRVLPPLAALVALLAFPRLVNGGTNVDDQRNRLPPPTDCPDDPVAGVWLAHTYEPDLSRWQRTKLDIYRAAPGTTRLKGTIVNETWWGPETEKEPGPCGDKPHMTVSMDADGDGTEGHVQFGAYGQWRKDADVCTPFNGTYYLDQFSGVIDPKIQEFQSENNDGGTAIHLPVVFRRIRCHTDPVWREPVPPPPFEPPKSGCACG
jgi:hypothetical protein